MDSSLTIALAIWVAAVADWREDLRQCFLSESDAQRSVYVDQVLRAPDATDSALFKALRDLKLWNDQPPGVMDCQFRVGKDAVKQAVVSIPPGYDPAKTWPLVIALHGQGQSAASMLQMTRAILDAAADDHIIIAPQHLGPLGFTEPNEIVDQPRQLLVSARRMFHVDSDRVFLMGYSIGSHNTWMAGIMHADCFAGIMPLATPLQVIGNDLLYDVLSPNLRNLDVLFVWGAKDTLGQDGRPHPLGGNAAMAGRLADAMRDSCGNRFTAVELPDAGHGDVRPPQNHVKQWLAQRRNPWPKEVHHTFRLVEQSRDSWVLSSALLGRPLADAPSTVKLKPDEDPQAAQKRHLTAQLGLLGATVRGQTISLTSRKSKGVVLLLSDELIDLERPVTIQRGKRVVFTGQIVRDRAVMLQETLTTWDFSRIPQARVNIPASGKKVTVGLPTAKSQK